MQPAQNDVYEERVTGRRKMQTGSVLTNLVSRAGRATLRTVRPGQSSVYLPTLALEWKCTYRDFSSKLKAC